MPDDLAQRLAELEARLAGGRREAEEAALTAFESTLPRPIEARTSAEANEAIRGIARRGRRAVGFVAELPDERSVASRAMSSLLRAGAEAIRIEGPEAPDHTARRENLRWELERARAVHRQTSKMYGVDAPGARHAADHVATLERELATLEGK